MYIYICIDIYIYIYIDIDIDVDVDVDRDIGTSIGIYIYMYIYIYTYITNEIKINKSRSIKCLNSQQPHSRKQRSSRPGPSELDEWASLKKSAANLSNCLDKYRLSPIVYHGSCKNSNSQQK